MGKIFVSYRVADTEWPAARVRDALVAEFGDDNVFYDGESLHRGDNWKDKIESTLDESEAMVLVVGPTWLDELERRAQGRGPDVHRQEVVAALRRGLPIFVTLVDDAKPLDAARLPRNLKRLGELEAQPLPRKGFTRHVPLLIEDVLAVLRRRRGDGAGDGAPGGAPRTVTVAEYGDADFLEIAEAVAAVPPGSTVLVRPGHYVDPVVIDHQVQLVGQPDGDEHVVLEVAESPALTVRAERARVEGLHVVCTAATGAVAIEVPAGRPVIEDCDVSARDHQDSVGISVRGEGAEPIVRACRAHDVRTGLRVSERARGRYDELEVEASQTGVAVDGSADPVVHGSRVRGGVVGVLVSDGAAGTYEALDVRGAAEHAVKVDGAAPTFRESTIAEVGHHALDILGAGTGTYDRLRIEALGDGIYVGGGSTPTVRETTVFGGTGCGVVVDEESSGRFLDCEVVGSAKYGVCVQHESAPTFERLVVRATGRTAIFVTSRSQPIFRRTTAYGGSGPAVDVGDGARPAFEVLDVTATNHRGVQITGAAGTYDDVTVAMGDRNEKAGVVVESDAEPLLRRLVVRGGKAGGVLVQSGALPTFEVAEVDGCVGDGMVVRSEADPTVRSLRVHHVKGDGLNVLQGGRGTYEDCEFDHTTCSGVRVATDAAPTVRGARIHDIAPKGSGGLRSGLFRANGIRVEGSDGATFHACVIERTRHAGVHVAEGVQVTFEQCAVDGQPWPPPPSAPSAPEEPAAGEA